jgi:hypothetical protein
MRRAPSVAIPLFISGRDPCLSLPLPLTETVTIHQDQHQTRVAGAFGGGCFLRISWCFVIGAGRGFVCFTCIISEVQ